LVYCQFHEKKSGVQQMPDGMSEGGEILAFDSLFPALRSWFTTKVYLQFFCKKSK